ncbi:ribosome small subunit-dependent GTPase A [Tardiphaga sp.]|uniref:ribosome small subunit-dependent GTPase A n=1 Tax=Tardiphaga sp. TaxID=1926292 RepID=UPI0025E48203|nr:ribosome small subunit-dependent GTPase A [Tardiphaga sp.]
MTDRSESRPAWSLADLGWSDFFAGQILPDEVELLPARIATVHRTRMTAIAQDGPLRLVLAPNIRTTDFAVGDWVLADPRNLLMQRRLDRRTVLQRRTEGSREPQLAGANIDTLFIVTSCNAEFNVARLERYLAIANEAGITPVIVLTKADLADDPRLYIDQASALQRDLAVVVSNPRTGNATDYLRPWCGAGQTAALVGSSGVGKSTMVNSLAGAAQELPQPTGGIREHDAQGRHTTTSRSLHAIAGGGWVIDTPGMRTLHVSEASAGIDELFAEITELAPLCKFRDCTHAHEPGCAVRAAVADGRLDAERLARWRAMVAENRSNTPGRIKPGGSRPSPPRRTRAGSEAD